MVKASDQIYPRTILKLPFLYTGDGFSVRMPIITLCSVSSHSVQNTVGCGCLSDGDTDGQHSVETEATMPLHCGLL